jgi:hypothetical protein
LPALRDSADTSKAGIRRRRMLFNILIIVLQCRESGTGSDK